MFRDVDSISYAATFLLRLARYCARNPVALHRLEYDAKARKVKYWSDKDEGPTAGAETVEALEFLARVTAHIPDKHQVMTRYYGWYANRTRGERRLSVADGDTGVAIAERERVPLSEARLWWAELLRRIFEVDPLRCPRCAGEMRIVAFITERAVIDRILAHLARARERGEVKRGGRLRHGPRGAAQLEWVSRHSRVPSRGSAAVPSAVLHHIGTTRNSRRAKAGADACPRVPSAVWAPPAGAARRPLDSLRAALARSPQAGTPTSGRRRGPIDPS
jgi:hypothetical protein